MSGFMAPGRRAIEHARGFRKARQVADRLRRPDQLPQARIRLEPHPGLDGRDGASIWCGHGVFTHNLVKISAMAA